MTVQTIGVLGAGQMGRGIAQVAAAAGRDVRLADATAALAEAGRERLAGALAKLVEKGKMAAEAREALLARVTVVPGLAGLADTDIVIEAASEDAALKERLFRELDATVREGAILASNTSSLSITRLASTTGRPDRVVGMHFFNPVPVLGLVEIVRALQTSDATYEAVKTLAEAMGKTVIVAKDSPGFLVNRMLVPFLNEACFALAEGLGSAEDIDRGATLGLAHPLGPLALADLIGLDTVLAIAEVLHRELGEDKYRPAPLLRTYVAAGWLGRKAGRGFFAYPT